MKNGCVLGFVSDIEINTSSGRLEAIVIFGRPRFLGIFGREEDIVIPWQDISVIGRETILVNTDPEPFMRMIRKNHYSL